MREKFCKYLLGKGYTRVEANEILKRLERGTGDYKDEFEMKMFILSRRKEKKNE